MAEIRSVFAVPMVFHRLDDCEALNRELEALFHRYADNPQAYANPNPIVERNGALFESRFQLFDWPQEPVQQLRRFCLSTLYGTIGELCGYDDSTLSRLHMAAESWFHLTQRGGYFGVHNHALHSWSGVYCVRHDGDDPNSASGRLSFINPNAAASMYMDMAIMNLKPPFGFGPVNLRLQPGQLVIFPSWLLHQVLPYEGDSTRITVAFNARFQLAEAPSR
jgi:Putative 2OG-Fe(II) oxygenase